LVFGVELSFEAARRGVGQADEVVVIGDGAHWIWNLAEQYFPQATQIVDWYHASEYLWKAGTAIHGDGTQARAAWVQQQLDRLWEGQLEQVVVQLEAHREVGDAVEEALNYYTTHRTRMDYPSYRARGLQIGSGTIESCCKQLVSARLKQAGMIWSEEGANAVVAVRAWLKSGRWEEAMALRAAPRRRRRQQRAEEPAMGRWVGPEEVDREGQAEVRAPADRQGADRLAPEVLAGVRAELAQERANHPWRRGWSRRQQQRQAAAQRVESQVTSTA
jgi:hypothetical protein